MKLKKITLMTVFSLLFFESNASLAGLCMSRAELSQLPQRVNALQTQVTTLQTQQNMLRDYSTIPDDLYSGVDNVAEGGLGTQLKAFLNNFSNGNIDTELADLRDGLSSVTSGITFGTSNNVYDDVITHITFDRSTADLQMYIGCIHDISVYILSDSLSRSGSTRSVLKGLIIDMLLYHPSGS